VVLLCERSENRKEERRELRTGGHILQSNPDDVEDCCMHASMNTEY